MRKSLARETFLIAVLLAALVSGFSAYGQKPPKRGVKDAAQAPSPTLPVGSYYALVIGINDI
jgi:hypothetical protein